MTRLSGFLVPGCRGVGWSVQRGEAGEATEGWRDKSAHIARGSVGWCHGEIRRIRHLVARERKVRVSLKLLIMRGFPRVAERRRA